MLFRTHQFAGARATYNYQQLNNELVPSKGLLLNGSVAYTKNLTLPDKQVMTYGSSVQAFVPLAKKWVWSSLGGIMAVTGQPEFYQLATVGGGATIRGFRRERFWGKTAFYSQNELQYLFPFRSYWFNGPMGVFGLMDAGRIWHPGEVSDKWHKSFGAGLILVPFNKIRVMLAYARSEERGMIHVGFRGRL
jgi:hemolysin activation/secretion protein